MTERLTTYRQFWPYYLREHARPATRSLHFVGTTLAILCLVATLIFAEPLFLLGAVVSGYLFAWVAHFFVERNRPATFRYPLWSLVSDFRMYFMWLAGRLNHELRRAGCERADNDHHAHGTA